MAFLALVENGLIEQVLFEYNAMVETHNRIDNKCQDLEKPSNITERIEEIGVGSLDSVYRVGELNLDS